MTSRLAVLLLCLGLAACRESDSSLAPSENSRVDINSDPDNASIFIDGATTGQRTPHTFRDLTPGRHTIIVRQENAGVPYGYLAAVDVRGDSLIRIFGPLMMRCTPESCDSDARKYHAFGTLRTATNANGALFYLDATGRGLFYPGGVTDTYASIGMPMIAMVGGSRDTLALGIYDVDYLAGRPAPEAVATAERFTLRQSFWIVPPTHVITSNAVTMRGIEVEEEVIATQTTDVAFIKLTYRNITDRPSYQAVDPFVPTAGITFNWVYLGFALDADIGAADDDMVTYDPSLNMVYMYDRDFREELQFGSTTFDRPALIGLRMMSAPAQATVTVLNAWPRGNDWSALGSNIGGLDLTHRTGWNILSGTKSLAPDMEGQQIGHAPNVSNDYRMSVSAGPITLRPGESASITVAVILAPPVQGTFASGQTVEPGNPNVATRQIQEIAAHLLAKARSLTAP